MRYLPVPRPHLKGTNVKSHIVPLIGGPLCGESMTIDGIFLPNNLPMHYEGKFYIYLLQINPKENHTEVYYQYNNESVSPTMDLKHDS